MNDIVYVNDPVVGPGITVHAWPRSIARLVGGISTDPLTSVDRYIT